LNGSSIQENDDSILNPIKNDSNKNAETVDQTDQLRLGPQMTSLSARSHLSSNNAYKSRRIGSDMMYSSIHS